MKASMLFVELVPRLNSETPTLGMDGVSGWRPHSGYLRVGWNHSKVFSVIIPMFSYKIYYS